MTESMTQTLVGAFAGCVEVTAMQPTIAMKNALQERRPLPVSPVALYRGYAVNISTVAPLTAFQFGATSMYREMFKTAFGRSPKREEVVACAAAGGATAAIVACPAELIVVQQQRAGISAGEAYNRVVGGHGATGLYRGLVATALRDGLVCSAMLGLCPVIVEELNKFESAGSLNRTTKLAIGSAVAGIAGTIVSMPFDSAKTLQQAYLDTKYNPEYTTVRSTMEKIWSEGGLGGVYSGTAPRGFRIVCAAFILNSVKDWAEGALNAFRGV